MAHVVRYLSHPEVVIDPATPIPDWSLSDVGVARVQRLAASGALAGTRRVISSAERKAIETASPLAQALGCELEVRQMMHENDRSATGFLPPEVFEAVADQFFAAPDDSLRGWETARAAQTRIVAEMRACLASDSQGDVLCVGHGGVGTLLFCHLSGYPISRKHDQGPGGGGCYFELAAPEGVPKAGWQPLEALIAAASA
ncbi:MAG: histidine phosphatase family protein [Pseudomonadota bacterium]